MLCIAAIPQSSILDWRLIVFLLLFPLAGHPTDAPETAASRQTSSPSLPPSLHHTPPSPRRRHHRPPIASSQATQNGAGSSVQIQGLESPPQPKPASASSRTSPNGSSFSCPLILSPLLFVITLFPVRGFTPIAPKPPFCSTEPKRHQKEGRKRKRQKTRRQEKTKKTGRDS